MESKESPSTREAALDWTRRALAVEVSDTASIETRAENLVAIAEAHHVRIEVLVEWIHTPADDKQWSAAEFRRFCHRLSEEA